MGQQPNIELDREDAPPLEPAPGPSPRWRPDRPGEITGPDEMPWGGAFGRPGPDTGFAMKLIRRADFTRARVTQLEALLAAYVGARASAFGRAPVPKDVEAGLIVLGLRPDGLPSPVVTELATQRERWLDATAHEHTRGSAFVASLTTEQLTAAPDDLLRLLAA